MIEKLISKKDEETKEEANKKINNNVTKNINILGEEISDDILNKGIKKEEEEIYQNDPKKIMLKNKLLEQNKKNNSELLTESQLELAKFATKSPDLFNFLKSLIHNPQVSQFMKNSPEVKKLLETDPGVSNLLNDTKLMDKLLTPEIFQAFVQIVEIDRNKDKIDNKNNIFNDINNNDPNNNISLLAPQQKKEDNFSFNLKKEDNNGKKLNDMIKEQKKQLKQKIKYFYTFPEYYQENFNKLKEMGYEDEKIKIALIINEGFLEAALNYLDRHNKNKNKDKNKNKNQNDKEDEK